MKCLVCPNKAEIHHIHTRKSHPELIDNTDNHMPLCRLHHVKIHAIGRNTFIRKYKLERWMKNKGWSYDAFFKRWFLTKSVS